MIDMDCSSPLSSAPDPSPPTSPLSHLSRTPSLPNSPDAPIPAHSQQDPAKRYPSPMSTTASGAQSPIKLGPLLSSSSSESGLSSPPSSSPSDGPPPAKKRRITAAPKERTTEYLDLTKPDDEWQTEDEAQLQRLMTALRRKKKIVVVAGAGISVSAGIPDFRSSTGLFAPAGSQQTKMRASGKHLFDASVYKHDASTQSFHTMVREMGEMSRQAKPTPFHNFLASLAHEGRLLRLYSQNIDCIDTSLEPLATNVPLNSKGPWPATVQLHGGLKHMVCTKCAVLSPFDGSIFEGPEAPLCKACIVTDEVRTAHAGKRSHGIGRVRPRFVLYNEYNPDEEAIGNVSSADLKARPDAVLVVGTSLKVPGTRRLVKELCQVARGRRDGFTAWINVDSEPRGVEFRDCWDLVVRSPCDDVATAVALPPWDCAVGDDYLIDPKDHVAIERRCSETTIEVNINSRPSSPKSQTEAQVEATAATPTAKLKKLEDVQANSIPTPRPSPKIAAVRQLEGDDTSTATEDEGKKTKAGRKKGSTVKKQTKLLFGKATTATSSTTTTTTKKPAKTAKAPRKSRPSKKDAASKNTPNVLDSFKTAKNVADPIADKKPKDLSVSVGLPDLRPERPVANNPAMFVEAPTTPVQPERPVSRDTISPTSVPRSMRGLIDVQ